MPHSMCMTHIQTAQKCKQALLHLARVSRGPGVVHVSGTSLLVPTRAKTYTQPQVKTGRDTMSVTTNQYSPRQEVKHGGMQAQTPKGKGRLAIFPVFLLANPCLDFIPISYNQIWRSLRKILLNCSSHGTEDGFETPND